MSSIERLVEGYLGAINISVHQEFSFLKEKFRALDNPSRLQGLIDEQRDLYERQVFRHSKNFREHYERFCEQHDISTVFPGDDGLKDDVLAHFFINHDKQLHRILHAQEKSLKTNPITRYLRKVSHTRTRDYLLKEEQVYGELLLLLHTKAKSAEQLSEDFAHLDYLERIRQGSRQAAIPISAVPLGPLELVALPFWASYLSVGLLEKHNAAFSSWQQTKKHRIH